MMLFKSRRSFDWRRAARLLRSGTDPDAVADTIGVESDHLWRHLQRSARFRRFLDLAADTRLATPADELVNLVRNKQK